MADTPSPEHARSRHGPGRARCTPPPRASGGSRKCRPDTPPSSPHHRAAGVPIATRNDASKLPPEFARAERFDGVFFVDLPGREQKDAIWGISTRHYGLDPRQARPDDSQWTGAEIKSCCRLASLLDVPLVQSAQNVVPVAVTAGDKIESLRQWASGRCLSADRAGVYSQAEVGTGRGLGG